MSQEQKIQQAGMESAEPTAGASTVPIWIIVVMAALMLWGAFYVDFNGDRFNPQVFEPYNSYAEVVKLQPYDPKRAFLAEGEDVFNKTCAACHQANGLGKEGQFPPLAGSDWLLAPSATRIGRIVLRGLSGSIRVDANGKLVALNGTMPPQIDVWDDEHLAAVLTYVRQQWGNNAPEIKPDEIKALRAAVANHPGSFNPDELLKMPLQPLK